MLTRRLNVSLLALFLMPLLLATPASDVSAAPDGTSGLVSSTCGNGEIEAGEICDDGDLEDGDGCDSNCRPTRCGNGVVTAGEECDDGNLRPALEDGCQIDCLMGEGWECSGSPSECVATAVCGDGEVGGREECDDGNTEGGDGCGSNCLVELGGYCVSDPLGGGSQCLAGAACRGSYPWCPGCGVQPPYCTPVGCGDGEQGEGEECDDGNLTSGDGCDHNCLATACGNAVVTAGEECDDGDLISGDGCDAECLVEGCGNDRQESGEECDDGNRISGDGCDADCSLTGCGNGIVTEGEECDDSSAYCTPSCELSGYQCGNGSLQNYGSYREACDDGNREAGDGCDEVCRIEANWYCGLDFDGNRRCSPACGDGAVAGDEECDGSFGLGCDGNCRLPGCGNGSVSDVVGCTEMQLAVSVYPEGSPTGAYLEPLRDVSISLDLPSNASSEVIGEGQVWGLVGSTLGVSQSGSELTVQSSGVDHLSGEVVYVEVGCLAAVALPSPESLSCEASGVDGLGLEMSLGCDLRIASASTVVIASESCDDGNTEDGDGYSATCQLESCGDGVVDEVESCDDGNLIDGDCCSSSCLLDPAGTVCDDDGLICTVGLCDGAGSCTHEPGNGGQVCREAAGDCDIAEVCTGSGAFCPGDDLVVDGSACGADGICSSGICVDQAECPACMVCVPGLEPVYAPASECSVVIGTRGEKFIYRDNVADGRDKLEWLWKRGERTTRSDWGDPENFTSYDLCIFTGQDGAFAGSIYIPGGGSCGGRPCWREKGLRRLEFRDREAANDGASKLRLMAGEDGKALAQLKGQGVELPDLSLPLGLPVRIQLQNSEGGCWETVFEESEVKKNSQSGAKLIGR